MMHSWEVFDVGQKDEEKIQGVLRVTGRTASGKAVTLLALPCDLDAVDEEVEAGLAFIKGCRHGVSFVTVKMSSDGMSVLKLLLFRDDVESRLMSLAREDGPEPENELSEAPGG